MNELDWAIVIVLALSTIVGVARGVIREILSIVGWVIGIVFALKYSTELADKSRSKAWDRLCAQSLPLC